MFFCKYNDPIYVKLEKLDIMIALASERNIDQVLLELKEYATEVDVDFVRKVSPAQKLSHCVKHVRARCRVKRAGRLCVAGSMRSCTTCAAAMTTPVLSRLAGLTRTQHLCMGINLVVFRQGLNMLSSRSASAPQ